MWIDWIAATVFFCFLTRSTSLCERKVYVPGIITSLVLTITVLHQITASSCIRLLHHSAAPDHCITCTSTSQCCIKVQPASDHCIRLLHHSTWCIRLLYQITASDFCITVRDASDYCIRSLHQISVDRLAIIQDLGVFPITFQHFLQITRTVEFQHFWHFQPFWQIILLELYFFFNCSIPLTSCLAKILWNMPDKELNIVCVCVLSNI